MNPSLGRFKRRAQRSGMDTKEIAINEGIRNFRKALNENPTCFEVQATVPDKPSISSNEHGSINRQQLRLKQ